MNAELNINDAIKSQYHAALLMLQQSIENCPESLLHLHLQVGLRRLTVRELAHEGGLCRAFQMRCLGDFNRLLL